MISPYLGSLATVFNIILLGIDLLFWVVVVALGVILIVRGSSYPKLAGLRLVGAGLLIWSLWSAFSNVLGRLFEAFYGWERFQYEWGPFWDALLVVARHTLYTSAEAVALALVVLGAASVASALAAAAPDPAR